MNLGDDDSYDNMVTDNVPTPTMSQTQETLVVMILIMVMIVMMLTMVQTCTTFLGTFYKMTMLMLI